MECRPPRYIMNPAMIATFVFGLWLIWELGSIRHLGWLHAKLMLVLLLAVIYWG